MRSSFTNVASTKPPHLATARRPMTLVEPVSQPVLRVESKQGHTLCRPGPLPDQASRTSASGCLLTVTVSRSVP
jgi:hypothetical protein